MAAPPIFMEFFFHTLNDDGAEIKKGGKKLFHSLLYIKVECIAIIP